MGEGWGEGDFPPLAPARGELVEPPAWGGRTFGAKPLPPQTPSPALAGSPARALTQKGIQGKLNRVTISWPAPRTPWASTPHATVCFEGLSILPEDALLGQDMESSHQRIRATGQRRHLWEEQPSLHPTGALGAFPHGSPLPRPRRGDRGPGGLLHRGGAGGAPAWRDSQEFSPSSSC
jgi:hypothetical protein